MLAIVTRQTQRNYDARSTMRTKTEKTCEALPFLKWAGGKRWFASTAASLLPTSYERYIEPFVGSGALFFHLQPSRAILADLNEELVATYNIIKKSPNKLLDRLSIHNQNHDENYYYQLRAENPESKLDRAARFIYLNRTCWNGLYRVNKKGIFNVPIGTKSDILFDGDNILRASKTLAETSIVAQDFEKTIGSGTSGDLIFVDPPYTANHNKNGF